MSPPAAVHNKSVSSILTTKRINADERHCCPLHSRFTQIHRQRIIQRFAYAVDDENKKLKGQRHPVEPLSHSEFEFLHKPFDVAEVSNGHMEGYRVGKDNCGW